MKDLLQNESFVASKGATLTGAIVGLVVGVILITQVAIPVTDAAINSTVLENLSAAAKLVLGTTIIMLAIVPVVMVAQML